MSGILVWVLEKLGMFLRFLFLHFRDKMLELWRAKDGVPFNQLLIDTLSVFRGTGMMLIFNILAALIFIILPQGKDILLIVSEDIGEWHFSSLAALAIATLVWSVFAEFAARYAIYVTDNSGNSLSEARVQWRKTLQQTVTDLFLVLPYIIIIIGHLSNHKMKMSLFSLDNIDFGFWVPLLTIYGLLTIVADLYYSKRELWQKLVALPELEFSWCNKLTGIYNEYVFFLHKHNNFAGKAEVDLQTFETNFLSLPPAERNEFPKNFELISDKARIPGSFQLVQYSDDSINNSRYRWTYRIPNSFYSTLHKQVLGLVLISAVYFVFILFSTTHIYQLISAPGLVVGAFACWTGVYTGVLYLDYSFFRKGKPLKAASPEDVKPIKQYTYWSKWKGRFSARAFLFVMFFISSAFNDDHPIQTNSTVITDSRPSLSEHYKQWIKHFQADAHHVYYDENGAFTPLVFVCAEGGALRTGAYSSMMLGKIQDELLKDNVDLKDFIYAYSGVSGGSVGITYFNIIAHLENKHDSSYKRSCRKFFQNDFLAPVVGKLFYGEIFNLVIPKHVMKFDRAKALEDAWECGYGGISDSNYYGMDYMQLYNKIKEERGMRSYPAMFINTTEVESGMQCWLSNVRADTDMSFSNEVDLFRGKINSGIAYKTMVNFSSRFPLISPGACVEQDGKKKLHYVDGGYVENTGAATMLQVLKALEKDIRDTTITKIRIRPYVIVLRFAEESDKQGNVSFGNEMSEIAIGIYNTRGARVKIAQKELREYVESKQGQVIQLRLDQNGRQVPMNWVLSGRSMDNLDLSINDKWNNRKNNDLKKLFPFDTSIRYKE